MKDILVPAPTSEWDEKDWTKFRDWLKGMLQVSEATITFTKKDGSERVMRCTLNPNELPKVEIKEDKKERKVSTDTLAVYDLDSQGWRSFILKSIIRVNITL